MKPFLEHYKLGTFEVKGLKVPRVLLGCSPFMGDGQFGARAYEYYKRFYLKPENVKKVVLRCIDLGMNAVQPVGYRRILEPIHSAMKEANVELFILGSAGVVDIDEEMELMLDLNAKCIVIHASLVNKNLANIKGLLREIKARGILTGIATHTPGIEIPFAEEVEEVDLILAPLNKLGRFTEPSLSSTLRAIENSSKRIIAIKPLAAGALKPFEAFEFLAGKVDGVAVGITDEDEAKEVFKAAAKFFK
ncbi:MAG: hypothetical protein QXJ68_07555 [Methanocellales archaeon]